jgi:hypothetical protein
MLSLRTLHYWLPLLATIATVGHADIIEFDGRRLLRGLTQRACRASSLVDIFTPHALRLCCQPISPFFVTLPLSAIIVINFHSYYRRHRSSLKILLDWFHIKKDIIILCYYVSCHNIIHHWLAIIAFHWSLVIGWLANTVSLCLTLPLAGQ